jgi:hypothetical protein
MSKLRPLVRASIVTFAVSAGIMGGMTVLAPAAHAAACKQPCAADDHTVICRFPDGTFNSYQNSCFAACAGAHHCGPA